jgi:hypothetical protein
MRGRIEREEKLVKNPLDSLTGTIVSGLVITIVLFVIVKMTGV